MEEYDLIKRIQHKTQFRIIPRNVLVSARKYQTNGAFRLQAAYGLVMLLFFLGIKQESLVKLYRWLIR